MDDNSLGVLIGHMNDRQKQAEAVYAALRTNERIRKKARTLVYRCPNRTRCALAEVYASPAGVLIHHPSYKLSRDLNEQGSSADGRAANTTDGDRHWKVRTYFLEAAVNLALNCDHVHHVVIDREHVEWHIREGITTHIVHPDTA
ncbi:hypothetical protein GCM10009670_04120 [Citricoccus alkalitolerans]